MKDCHQIHFISLRAHVCLPIFSTPLFQVLWLRFIKSLHVDCNSYFFLHSAELVTSQKGNEKTRFLTSTHSFSIMLLFWDFVAMSYFIQF